MSDSEGASGSDTAVRLAKEQKSKSQLKNSIEDIIVAQADRLEMRVTRQTVSSLISLIHDYSACLATDLETFAHHAKRQTITLDDVLLCARRSESLTEHLKKFAQNLEAEKKGKGKRAKKGGESSTAKKPKKAKKKTIEDLDVSD